LGGFGQPGPSQVLIIENMHTCMGEGKEKKRKEEKAAKRRETKMASLL